MHVQASARLRHGSELNSTLRAYRKVHCVPIEYPTSAQYKRPLCSDSYLLQPTSSPAQHLHKLMRTYRGARRAFHQINLEEAQAGRAGNGLMPPASYLTSMSMPRSSHSWLDKPTHSPAVPEVLPQECKMAGSASTPPPVEPSLSPPVGDRQAGGGGSDFVPPALRDVQRLAALQLALPAGEACSPGIPWVELCPAATQLWPGLTCRPTPCP